MVSIERLLERYGHQEYEIYGDCICIPGSEWVKKWEEDLPALGYEFVRTDFGNPNRPVYLIKIKEQDKEPSGEQKDIVPAACKMGRWPDAEKKKLLKLMDAAQGSVEEKAKSILKEFPGRPLDALLRQYAALTPAVEDTQERQETTEPSGPPGSIEPTATQETAKKKKRIPKKEADQKHEKEHDAGPPVKTDVVCNLSIHIEAKSAAAIKAVLTLVKELKGSK